MINLLKSFTFIFIRNISICLTIISLVIAGSALAQPKGGAPQFTVKGMVTDGKTGAALEFATITLRSLRDSSDVTGSISGSDGYFQVPNLKPGGYSVEIDFLGYEKTSSKLALKPGTTPILYDMGVVTLMPSAQLLKAAEIVADKSFMMSNIDRKTYNTDQLSVTSGGNVNDILQVIPSVEVDNEGTVSLRGSDNVTILIDGKPSGLTGAGGSALLESIPASSIEKIEVITNPSAKYDPDGVAGILNIVTKKNKLEGLTGIVEATTSFDNGYSGNAQINYMTGKWNLSTNYSYTKDSRGRDATTYSVTTLNDVKDYYDQVGESDNDRYSHNVRFATDYYVNTKSTVSAGVNLNTGNSDQYEINNYKYSDNSGAVDSLYSRATNGGSDNLDLDFDLSFRHKFNEEGRLLNILATASLQDNTNNNNYNQIAYFPSGEAYPESERILERDETVIDNKIYTVSADYEHPIGKDKQLEAGIKSTYRDLDNDYTFNDFDISTGEYLINTNRTNRFLYKDIVNAVYAQWRQSMGRFGYQIGVRAEQANVKLEQATTSESYNQDYFSVYPSAFVTWQIDEKSQLKASYSKRINRPGTRELNPFTDYEDPLNLRQGNPFLDPEYSNSMELEISRYVGKISLSLTGYYRYTYDKIQRYKYFLSDGVSVLTYENIDNSVFYGIDWAINGSPKKWWNLTLSGSVYRNETDASNVAGLTSSGYAWNGRIFTNFKLPYSSEFQVSYFYRSEFDVPQGLIKPMQFLNLALSKRILKERGTITFKVNDPFNLAEFRIDVVDRNFTQDIFRKRESQILTLGFKYRFGELRERGGRGRGRGDYQRNDMDGDM